MLSTAITAGAALSAVVGPLVPSVPVAARENAALALGLIENPQAIDALVAALQDDAELVRARSAWALGMIEDSSAVEALTEALEEEDAEVPQAGPEGAAALRRRR